MPESPYANFTKDGLDRLLKLGRALCAIVNTFSHIIASKYGSNPKIIALLEAIKLVCNLLPEAQAEFDSITVTDGLPPEDTGDINGINPSADTPPDIEPII